MNYTWSLDELYTSFDSNEFKRDLDELSTAGEKMLEFSQKELVDYNNATKKIEKYIELTRRYSELEAMLP